MLRTCVALLLIVGFAGTAGAASPDPKTLAVPPEELSRARELVQQLGSEQFAEREKAEQALAAMGRLARPALLEGVNSDPNPEVRSRCSALLPKANALDIKARLEVFLADAEGKYEHDLPGWNQFRSLVRHEWTLFGHPVWSDRSLDKAARGVFAELIAAADNRSIMLAASGPQADLGQLVAARRQELYNMKFPRAVVAGGVVSQPAARREPSTADLATLLFAESLVPSKFVPRTTAMSTLLSASAFNNAVREADEAGKVYRAVAVAWLESRLDPIEMYQAMSIATNINLPDQTVRLAVRLLTTPGTTAAYRGQAATQLARLGTKEHIPLLEKGLADSAVMITVRRSVVKDGRSEIESHDIQVRDVALAVSVILSGQKLEDYGFVDMFATSGGGVGGAYSYTRHYLPDDKRDEALAKWKEWREKHPDK